MTGLCPHCGYDLIQDEPIERPEISMTPDGDCCFHGSSVRLTWGESIVLWGILKAGGKCIPLHILAERMDYNGDHKVTAVLLCRVRKKLRAINPVVPIETVRGHGVRWAA